MNRVLILLLSLAMALPQTSCANDNEPETRVDDSVNGVKTLVVYFSQSGNTAKIAAHVAAITGADMWQIEAAEPYTSADLDYSNSSSRSSIEQNDASARPALKEKMINIGDYDVIYLGYPIWWGIAPRIILTFLEAHNLAGKTVIPFCTSASSGIGHSDTDLHSFAPDATWKSGHRFSGSASRSSVEEWVKTVQPESSNNNEGTYKMNIQVNGHTLTATMVDNSSTAALKDILNKGDLTIAMDDYGNFEKVGEIGQTLPTNDEDITTQAGDLILYLGHRFVIYYDTNTWNFTRLGRIDGVSQSELKQILGDGSVSVTLSLSSSSAITSAASPTSHAVSSRVFSLEGRQLASYTGIADTGMLDKGMYLVRTTFDNGKTITRKIVK